MGQVEQIRARHQLEQRIKRAIEQKYTLSRIMAKWRVNPDVVRNVAAKYGLNVERPSDNWVGRP